MRFRRQIAQWYASHKRDLPWRSTKNPYLIWLSEIILQQTRVDQGTAYYLKFSTHFPTVKDLASADEDQVLKLWQGLGYYSRARNLLATAKNIAFNMNGEFPDNYTDILRLKGVGQYTAAAISSFCFNEAQPVVDGNVYRVLSRHFGIHTPIDSTAGKKEFLALATEVLDKKDPATHNQAIMEFGALQCTPKNPDCNNCPLSTSCEALANNTIEQLPVKAKKIKQTDRFFNYLVLTNGATMYLNKREENDIWKGLYDFPLIETSERVLGDALVNREEFGALTGTGTVSIEHVSSEFKHVLSHQKIYATFWEVELKSVPSTLKKFLRIEKSNIHKFAVPRLIENYMDSSNKFD